MLANLRSLILNDGAIIEAVGWPEKDDGQQVLQISPHWRSDRQIRVEGARIRLHLNGEVNQALFDRAVAGIERIQVQGTWRDGAVVDALLQQPPDDFGRDDTTRRVPPVGPAGTVSTAPTESESAALAHLLETGVVIWHRTYLTPDSRRLVQVGSANPAAVRDSLSAVFPGGVEVVETPWTQSALMGALSVLAGHRREWNVVATGGGFEANGSGRFGATVSVLHVHPDLARWAESLPAGMLEIRTLIRPVTPI